MSIIELLDAITVNGTTEITANMTAIRPALIDLMVQEHREFLNQGYYFPKGHPLREEIEQDIKEGETGREGVYFNSDEFETAMADYEKRLESGQVFETVEHKLMSLIKSHFKTSLTVYII